MRLQVAIDRVNLKTAEAMIEEMRDWRTSSRWVLL